MMHVGVIGLGKMGSAIARHLLAREYPRASGYLKLANNTVIGVVATTLAEVLAVCERAGVDRRPAIESITGAFGRIASSKTQQLLDRDSEPRFSLNALLKDLLLAREADQSINVPTPILSCVLPTVEGAAARGLGDRDYIAVALEPELSGLTTAATPEHH
jgi:3-hydroxyisobutyrate dehydrogenase-like beta-hydroxyacid dehydrogenase